MSKLQRVLVKDLPSNVGMIVRVCGFVHTLRNQKKRQFLLVQDISGITQIFHEKSDNEDLSLQIASLTTGSTVEIIGRVVANPAVNLGGVEVVIESLEVSSLAESPLPIVEDSSLEMRLDWKQISLRLPANALIMRVQTVLEHAMRRFWIERNFIEIHSPKLMGTASESGAELFSLEYFGGKAFLAQSPQFYKQMAMAAGLEKIFEIGPVFRANPSYTSRHDTEFTSVDVEVSWVESHEDVMALEEELLQYAVNEVSLQLGDEIRNVFGVEVKVPNVPFPRITLDEARHMLAERGHVIEHKADLDPPGERMLAEYIQEQFGHEFVFVTDYPAEVRAFYHMRYPDRPDITKSFDLLWKGLEITTGAQREHRYEILKKQAVEKGYSLGSLEHYLNFFRYGCPPHGGFGVGLTRILMVMLNRKSVREVTYVYRGPNRLTP
jgi:aspartyl-tRNA synthetase